MKKKLYMDLCCLNRPSDAQDEERVQIETEAVVVILGSIQGGHNLLVGSRVLDWECGCCPNKERQAKLQNLLTLASIYAEVGREVIGRADELSGLGFAYFDALHIACAESVNADYFLTTDAGILRRCRRLEKVLRVKVCNPADWGRGV